MPGLNRRHGRALDKLRACASTYHTLDVVDSIVARCEWYRRDHRRRHDRWAMTRRAARGHGSRVREVV